MRYILDYSLLLREAQENDVQNRAMQKAEAYEADRGSPPRSATLRLAK